MDTNPESPETTETPAPDPAATLAPSGIAAMQGDDEAVDVLQERVDQLKAETEAKEDGQLAEAQKGQAPPSAEPVTTIAPGPPDQTPFKPGTTVGEKEQDALAEGEPLDEKPNREGSLKPPAGWHPGGPEGGG